MPNLHQLLKAIIEKGASDLHITTGSPPQLRIDGRLVPLKTPPLTPVETRQLCYSVLTDAQKHKFEEDSELDLSFGVKGLSRFRANIFMQRGAVAGAFRTIPFKILSFSELGLPKVVAELANRPRGLVLVTGPTGSGKSTTLASIIDKVNNERHEHIITVEDPIEYLHPHKNGIVHQREVGAAQMSFVLQGIMSQQLLPKASGQGRVLATEVMVPNAAIRNWIREDKVHQIYSQMQVGQSRYGMQTMNQCLLSLYQKKLISMDDCLGRSTDVDELRNMLASDSGDGTAGQHRRAPRAGRRSS